MDAAKPQRIVGYRQNRELAIICALWAVLIFFRLEEIFGATGLRQYYSMFGWFSLTVLSTISVLLWIWNVGVKRYLIILGIMFFVVLAGFFYFRKTPAILFSQDSVLTGLSDWVIAIGFIASILTCLWGVFRSRIFTPKLVKVATISMLSIVWVVSAGVALNQLNRTFWGSVHFGDHHYFLQATGDFGPEHLLLYECDEYALACKQIYRSFEGSYEYHRLSLVANESGIEILYGDEVVYTYEQSP